MLGKNYKYSGVAIFKIVKKMDILKVFIKFLCIKEILNYLYRFINCAKVQECYQRAAFIYEKKLYI